MMIGSCETITARQTKPMILRVHYPQGEQKNGHNPIVLQRELVQRLHRETGVESVANKWGDRRCDL